MSRPSAVRRGYPTGQQRCAAGAPCRIDFPPLQTYVHSDADMSDPIPLLDDTDPPPFRVAEGSASSPFVIAADHAGRTIPRGLGSLGLSPSELDTHIAWDIGIGAVAHYLAAHLEAFYIAQTYSRLVIDCNRPLVASSSIVQQSEYTSVPGNAHLTPQEAEARAAAIFHPYHERIETELARRERAGQRTIFIAMHSFTPRFKGFERPWHCGVLYNRDRRLAAPLLDLLRREGLEVGDNQPYFVSDDSDYGIPRYGEARGNLCIELEVRQDLISSEAQQARWGDLLARVLREAVDVCDTSSP
jgi:predicted N-formylglutamate amidohydrolase